MRQQLFSYLHMCPHIHRMDTIGHCFFQRIKRGYRARRRQETTILQFGRKIREQLSLSVSDALEWEVKDGRIIVTAPQSDFLKYKNSIHVGAGDIQRDIQQARKKRAGRYT